MESGDVGSMNNELTTDDTSSGNGNDPPNDNHATSGDPEESNRELFHNIMPETLQEEIIRANANGVKPLSVGDANFDAVINAGTIKWAVSKNGELKIVPKIVNKKEISHAVIFQGDSVAAAGEADIAGTQGKYILLDISNESGHYMPSADSLEIGIRAFAKAGII
jgi:hypothetical protein